jgi:hypothetical protein
MKLDKKTIRALALPDGLHEKTFFDGKLPGFGLRLRTGGSRRWVVQYKINGRHRRMVLGSTAVLGWRKARKTAKRVLAKVRLGRDPVGEKIAARVGGRVSRSA